MSEIQISVRMPTRIPIVHDVFSHSGAIPVSGRRGVITGTTVGLITGAGS